MGFKETVNTSQGDKDTLGLSDATLDEEEKSLSSEFAKLVRILSAKNEHNLEQLLKRREDEIKRFKTENDVLQTRCDKTERNYNYLEKQITKMENELLETTLLIQGVHEGYFEESPERYDPVTEVLATLLIGRDYESRKSTARKIMIKNKEDRPLQSTEGQTHICDICLQRG